MMNAADFWNERYLSGETGWDIGYASPPLTHYIDAVADKDASILIPGCGNAYEALYLSERGFRNVTLIDISAVLVENLRRKLTNTDVRVIHGDFFLHQGKYDLMLEQTFFCAIAPAMRQKYVQQAHSLLTPRGRVAGVLFSDFGFADHPPFIGTEMEYKALFKPHFHIRIMAPCYNSIKPRSGNEMFFELEKKHISS